MIFDVLIVGGGLIGGSLALRLAQGGLKTALVEAYAPQEAVGVDGWDSRMYALSPGSIAFLDVCGAWAGVDQARVMAVEDMRIFGDDAVSNIDFNAYDAGLRELAVIVESRQVQFALWQALRARPEIEIFAPATSGAMHIDEQAATLELADGRILRALLIVGADGGESRVRTQAGIKIETRPYAQTAVVANFAVEKAHSGVAYQWFRDDGILALLPLPGEHVSMVWSVREARAAELMMMTPGELAAQVAAASGDTLGAFQLITPAAAFPLRLQRVREMVRPRLALVGDAAHNVHPLAGQGVNLGFRDARELAAVIAARGAQTDCGDYFLLRRYERARREDIAAMQLATDGLQRLFGNESALLGRARNFGLRLTNSWTSLKNFLVHHAIG
jgi:ubiquinone biosynthesis UbiH/UbiF/VisC/COQ6 family hydroxylase